MLRWWSAVAVPAVFVLGWAVGRGTTPLDSWLLAIDGPDWLIWFIKPWVLAAVLVATCAVALWRGHWRLALVVALCPPVAVAAAQGLKRVFGRELDGGLAYPSGHVTALVAIAGMVILVAGMKRWVVMCAAAVVAVEMYAVGTTFHYFTDTVGALLLGTAAVAIAVQLAGRRS